MRGFFKIRGEAYVYNEEKYFFLNNLVSLSLLGQLRYTYIRAASVNMYRHPSEGV